MIASRQHVGARSKQIITDRRSDTKTPRCILAIDHGKIGCEVLPQIGKLRDHRIARGTANNITQKQYPHLHSHFIRADFMCAHFI